jgi:hypothetical protein
VNSIAPTGYVLEGGITPGSVLASLPTNSTVPTYTFSAPTGSYYIRLLSLAGAVRSAASNEIRIAVNIPSPPSAPANLLGSANGSTLSLAWTNTASGGTPTELILDVTGSLSLSLSIPVSSSFSFPNVANGTYTFSLRASNSAGVSAPSNPVTLTFPGGCTVPGTPTLFAVTRNGNIISATWGLPAGGSAPTGYTLIVTGAFNGQISTSERSISGAVGAGSYTLSVSALNACGTGAPTATQTIVVP